MNVRMCLFIRYLAPTASFVCTCAQSLLEVLYQHAPGRVQVFGVRPLLSDCVELKTKLERGDRIPWHAYSIYVHAAVYLVR